MAAHGREKHPDVAAGSTNLYQNWEVVDPEKWVPHGYACVRVDSRGAGCSPGFIDHFSPRETKDFYDCIEWAGVQPWSNGKVGLNGISYYGINQWHVASLQPPHLAAMCVWEGAADWYRDMTHHGGILCTFWANWYDMQVKTVQYGAGERGKRSRVTASWCAGRRRCRDERARAEPLRLRRRDPRASARRRLPQGALAGSGTRSTTPLLSAANWGGQGLHPRGNFEGFVRAASKDKWLEAHGIEHWTHFYTDYGRELQLRFFDYFLKGKNNGWDKQPRVLLQVRHPGEKFVERARERMAARAHASGPSSISTRRPARSRADAATGKAAMTLRGAWATASRSSRRRSKQETEITGPSALKLFVSSSTSDADLFVVLRVFTADLQGGRVPGRDRSAHARSRQGWLRASHRKLDPKLSTPYRPYHTPRREAAAEEPARWSSSTSRSGRPRSWSRRATASR